MLKCKESRCNRNSILIDKEEEECSIDLAVGCLKNLYKDKYKNEQSLFFLNIYIQKRRLHQCNRKTEGFYLMLPHELSEN